MKRIKCIGVNHHVANTEQREMLLDEKLSTEKVYTEFKRQFSNSGFIVVSTCNRFEIFFDSDQSLNTIKNYFLDFFKIDNIENLILTSEGEDAIKHIIKVTASLDSMIVGETQITGQIKNAFRESKDLDACTPTLQKIMEIAFSTTKKVRQNTKLGEKSVSIAQSGIDLASRIFELKQKTILIIGAGQMSRVACQYLTAKKSNEIIIANRTIENASKLATQFNGKAIHIDRINAVLKNCDLIFCATAATKPVIKKELISEVQKIRKNKPLVLIDVCIPRNIEETCSDINGVFRFDIDAIGNLRDENIAFRQSEADKALSYIDQATDNIQSWLKNRGSSELLKDFKKTIDQIFEQELSKTIKKKSWIKADPELHRNIEGLIGSIKSKVMTEYKKKVFKDDKS